MADIDHIGKYEIRREIGRGAMGVVYEAYDPMIKRVVALKTIREDQLSGEDSAQMINRFRREAQAAGRLNHPNIVSIYDFGDEAGIWFVIDFNQVNVFNASHSKAVCYTFHFLRCKSISFVNNNSFWQCVHGNVE